MAKHNPHRIKEIKDWGYRVYADKPTLKAGLGTWSDEEYGHPGLQNMYVPLAS